MSALICINGPNEGELQLHVEASKIVGACTISQQPSCGPNRRILYRFRVKDSSICLSKTYGILGRNAVSAPSPSVADSIQLFTDEGVANRGRLTTLRVEYVEITPAQFETLATGIDRASCRTYFETLPVSIYDVKCIYVTPVPLPLKPRFSTVSITLSVVIVGGAALAVWMRRRWLG